MIIRLKRPIGACMLAGALLILVAGCQHHFNAAHAATYYVATTGDNSNPGTEAQPFRTIAHAVNTMVAGDTTYVRGGTYSGHVRFRRSGRVQAPIKLLNYPGENPIIDFGKTPATVTSEDMILLQSGRNTPIGWITIEGFEIQRGWKAIKWHNLHDSVIRRNWMHDALRGSAILAIGGTRVLIDRNRISHNAVVTPGDNETGGHGVYLHGSAYTLTNNIFYDNHNFEIQMNGSSTSAYNPAIHPSPEFAGAANWVIANNTLAYNKNGAGIVVWGSLCNNARIENNIFYENAVNKSSSTPQGVHFTGASSATGIQIRNNHFYASGSGGTVAIGVTGATEGVTYTQSDNIVNVSPPGFVNGGNNALPSSPDWRLRAGSPAIDKGLTLSAVTTDFTGTARTQGRAYDIGAYEYNAGGDSNAPFTVQNVQIH